MRIQKFLLIAIIGLMLVLAHTGTLPTNVNAQVVPTITTAPTPSPVSHATSWRLPFTGSMYISNGPGEGFHINTSAEAIDYAPSPAASMQVLAPMDGVVIDYITGENSGFGNVLRIFHSSTNACSFFAHLDSAVVTAGASVTQGQHVAWSGNSGAGGAGFHLHFEARSGCQAGNVFSGSPIPLRPLMGNWWNPWYAPPAPNATLVHDPNKFSGGAQFPENSNPPLLVTQNSPRHLAGSGSPPDFPSAYASNVGINIGGFPGVWLHMGAAPDAPNTSTDAHFQVQEFRDGQSWFVLSSSFGTTFGRSMEAYNRCGPNGQYCFAIRSKLVSDTTWNQQTRYIDVLQGQGGTHITAFYNSGERTVVLEFATVDIPPWNTTYYLYEWHGGQVFVSYLGRATQVTVNRIAGASNTYSIVALLAPGLSYSTGWLYLHDNTVAILPYRVYLPIIQN